MPAKRTASQRGLGAAGRRLYDSVTSEFELDEHELSLLMQASRTADTLEDLQKAIDADGIEQQRTLKTKGPHWALAELRQQRIVLARLLTALELPVGEEGVDKPKKTRNRATRFEKLRAVEG